MARKPETIFKDRIRPQLKALPNSYWAKIQQTAIVGTPDFLGCINGRFVALELKRSGKEKLRPMQIYNFSAIGRAKGIGLVVCPENWKDVLTFLQLLANDSSGGLHAHLNLW